MATCAVEPSLNQFSEEDIKLILSRYNNANDSCAIENYSVNYASNKMLGFLAEYWKVKVHLKNRKVLHFFIKAISRTNIAKAEMVKEMKLFDKESSFYSEIKTLLEVSDLKPWGPKLITALKDAMVFEDLNALQYTLRNKFDRFDMAHTLQALKTLARFHASSIIFEQNKRQETHSLYKINDDFAQVLGEGGYHISCEWYVQCMAGALDAMKTYSKYDAREINLIESRWHEIWSTALDLSSYAPGRVNVICHRDLWNNNLMFRYRKDGNDLVPDDCLFVDFQAVRYQPPASDVMVLLCCNLDPKFRLDNMGTFLDFYYDELQRHLSNSNIDNILSKEEFLISAEEQTMWGLVVCACLIPQFWVDDDVTTKVFCDNVQFEDILNKNKGHFIKKMMKENNLDYRQKVMEIFEEIADRYCFNENK
ncbi:uncharacterized protein LOC142977894 [Anticarsia gemmatalis]|uniref:uncharacterized protein LOC142977894 n=1 Tax=Anticarsia gemmatalis TaxID=129554 RepID=UPI003F757CA2